MIFHKMANNMSSMLLLLLLFISPSLSSPTNDLSFSSKDSISTIENDPSFVYGNIVEKKFKFPGLVESGPSVEELGHHAGFYSLPRSKAARLFYFFFESRTSKDDPVVIWLAGGPGCGSEIALFYENGPFHFGKNLSLVWNEYGWDKASNIIFIDQPIGTGFSYTTNKSDIPHDENGVSNDLYDFLQTFFKKHPQFVKNDFYIAGESYAGHYIPAVASRIHQGNKAKEGLKINLKGFAIGNGLTNPEIQYRAYTDYALGKKLINKADYHRINKLIPACENATKICGIKGGDTCLTAYNVCDRIFNGIMQTNPNTSYYDIRLKCGPGCVGYGSSDSDSSYDLVLLLNKTTVKKALGVGDIDFTPCSGEVHEALMQDWMKNLEVGIPSLLEDGIKVLVYAGEYDFVCNWLGNSRWVHAMKWSGQKEFRASPITSFLVDGKEKGQLRSHGPLSFLKVYNAGHFVPLDQPKAAFQMFKDWMQGKLAVRDGEDNVSPKYL